MRDWELINLSRHLRKYYKMPGCKQRVTVLASKVLPLIDRQPPHPLASNVCIECIEDSIYIGLNLIYKTGGNKIYQTILDYATDKEIALLERIENR